MYNSGSALSPFPYSGSNSYRNSNIYSNQYSRPIPQGQENIPMPHPTFRQDIWGSLHGFQALLGVLYAGTGIVHFGKIFLRMSFKLLKAVFGKSMTMILRMTGFRHLKQLLKKFANDGGWLREFSSEGTTLERVWGITQTPSQTISGKIILVLRVVSLFGALVSMFLYNREIHKQSKQEQEQEQVEMLNPNLVLASFEEKIECEQEIELMALVKENEEQTKIPQKEIETIKVQVNSDVNTDIDVGQESMVQGNFQRQIVAEDFWKNKDVFETIQEERSKKTEFVLPSVLQNLKKSASGAHKPWLSKNRKLSEVHNQPSDEKEKLNVPELNVVAQSQTNSRWQVV